MPYTPPPPPPAPPFNDALYQALNPLKQVMSDKQRVEAIMQKYGQTLPRQQPPQPPRQWKGDNNA